MIYERYSARMREKLKHCNGIYANFIFNKVGELRDTVKLETTEHLRSVPTDGWESFSGGFGWGGEWQNLWVKGYVTVPAEAAGKKLYAVAKTGAVEILYYVNGRPAGIFNSKGDYIGAVHSAELITADAVPDETFELAFECYAGHHCAGTQPYERYGVSGDEYSNEEFKRVYEVIDVCVMDEQVKDFVFDLKTVLQLAESLPDNDFMRGKAANALEGVFEAIYQYPAHYPADVWRDALLKCREIMRPVLAEKGSDGQRGHVGIIGHSHMDTAWLWPVSETIRKCARTYANALNLMEQYPGYKFIQSSALHLDWMRRYYPDIFEGIKKQTAAGNYEPNGGVWVECDCNITSGELMVRQFLRGQLFTRKYLNYTSDSFWLPDTFGYNAAIPQIMRESEVKYFYTQKIAWGDLNSFPYDTFIWRGIDGSDVITHFNLMHCFPDVATTVLAVNALKDKQVYDSRLVAFGFGDGGGGPTFGMLEDVKRTMGLAGIPEQYYTTASDFMKGIEKDAVNLPVYNNELYLETHRGTLTQMHDIKRNNRKAEYALRDMEYFNVLTGGEKCGRSEELYDILLKNQFHDILPGTSINAVNDLTRKEVTGITDDARSIASDYAGTLTNGDGITLFNTLSFDRNDSVYLEYIDGCLEDADNQHITDICGRKILIAGGFEIPAFGSKSFGISEQCCCNCQSKFTFEDNKLTTPFAVVTIGENGGIESLIDTASGREVRRISSEPLNTFYMGEDLPAMYDNWDIDYDQQMKMKPAGKLISSEVIANGPLEFRIRAEYKLSEFTSLTQDMIFHAHTPQIDFHTLVNWNDKHQLLKVGFDVDIMSSTVKNEIQFGHFDRPTTSNNSFETAKFEVCNHKWTDISESRFGVAVLNDCKYAISTKGSDMRLTLHRSGIRPDTTGDRGIHEMTYSLLPHIGSFNADNVVKTAYMLNVPSFAVKGSLKAEIAAPVLVDASNIIVEAIKPAELAENAYVVRLYEAERNKTACILTVPGTVKKAYATNMLEDIKEELAINDGKINVEFGPFQIRTFMFVR
ncbi:MAG: alpha-mannosidase [Eubacteriales bacterium]